MKIGIPILASFLFLMGITAAAGPFADAFGVEAWWIASGIVIAAMGIVAFGIPSVMHVEESAPPDAMPGIQAAGA